MLQNKYETLNFIYYIIMAMIFQFGWAAVQLAHMALIPTITYNKDERVILNTIRYQV